MSRLGAGRQLGLPPIVDADCETLILGSFPGTASLAAGQYYAHPRNQFWPILAACLGEPLLQLDFPQRYARVLAHRIGIWDAIAACARIGSLDAAIREASGNLPARVLADAPRVRRVLLNGRAAQRHAVGWADHGIETCLLPSTSPAHAAMSFERKLQDWRSALAPHGHVDGSAMIPS